MASSELFNQMIQMIHHGRDVASATQEARDAADAHQPICITDRLNGLVRLTTKMLIHTTAARVTGHHRFG